METKNETSQPPSQIKVQVILDTNIVKKFADKASSKVFSDYLGEIISRNGTLVISEYSSFEILRGATIKTEEIIIPFIEMFSRLEVTREVLWASARLETLYKMDEIQPNQISDGDKIIAATSILNSSLILTANARDFPWPFFNELESKVIEFQDGKRKKCIVIALLAPNIDIILKRFDSRPKQ